MTTPNNTTLDEQLNALYKRWLRCWEKDNPDPLWLRDALKAAAAIGAAEAYEQALDIFKSSIDDAAVETQLHAHATASKGRL